MNELTRRSVLRRLAGQVALAGLGGCVSTSSGEPLPARRRMDIHVHLFGNGDSGSGCVLSKKITKGMVFGLLVRSLALRRSALDVSYEAALVEQVGSSGLDMIAVLAQDCVYDATGRPDMERTNFYVPNDYVFDVVSRHPEQMTPCVSINPDRRDCVAELERCFARGARLLKIHPPTQGVDISASRHTSFFRRCAALDVLVMVHTGHEHAAPVIDVDLADPRRLELALRQGCRVVACHSGSGWKGDRPDYFERFLEMARRHPRLFGDTSVMATATRAADLQRAIDAIDVRDRFVHGSDFPFPSWPIAFAGRLGPGRARELQVDANLLRRDFELKECLGIGSVPAARSYSLVFGRPHRRGAGAV